MDNITEPSNQRSFGDGRRKIKNRRMKKLIRSLIFKFKYKECLENEYWLLVETRKELIRDIYFKYGGLLKEISMYVDQNYDIYRVDENGKNPKGLSVRSLRIGFTYEKFINRCKKIESLINAQK